MEWISVKDIMPDIKQECLVCDMSNDFGDLTSIDKATYFELDNVLQFYKYDEHFSESYPIDVTHWIPIPKVPEVSK